MLKYIMMIKKADVEKYKPTKSCPGCRAAEEGRRQNHPKSCRKSMEEERSKDPVDAERNKRRIDEEVGREVEKRIRRDEAAAAATAEGFACEKMTQSMTPILTRESNSVYASKGGPFKSESSSPSPLSSLLASSSAVQA